MSRTYHGTRSPGTEYWSRRCTRRHGMNPGPLSKRLTHRAERRAGEAETEAALDEETGVEPEEDHYA